MHAETQSTERLVSHTYPPVVHSLTSLRFLAAAWVILFHFKEFFRGTGLETAPIAMSGFLGVDFFFVLSGFVLAHVYLPKLRAGRFDYWDFLVRRVGRVYPLHVLTLAATLALSAVAARAGVTYSIWDLGQWMTLPKGEISRGLFAHVTMIHAWGSTNGLIFNLPSWSISAEWFAYLLLPVFVLAMRPLLGRPLTLLAASVALLIAMDVARRVGTGTDLLRSTWNLGTLRILPSFVLGIALWRFGEGITLGRRLALTGFFAALVALVAAVQFGAPLVVIVLLLAAIVFLCADAERHGGLKALQHPFPVLLGEVSYSVYLWHFPLGVLTFDALLAQRGEVGALGGLGLIAVVLAGITFVSWVSYLLVEVPSRKTLIAAGKRLALAESFR
ncbi:acyltransferase family protein [Erythrobacter sp. NE805]|uniref:acyltransferase family protein n=1 Tax=Erythrobacter sp. NE805 TaxID=3389875 RepID=UPI00396AF0F6